MGGSTSTSAVESAPSLVRSAGRLTLMSSPAGISAVKTSLGGVIFKAVVSKTI